MGGAPAPTTGATQHTPAIPSAPPTHTYTLSSRNNSTWYTAVRVRWPHRGIRVRVQGGPNHAALAAAAASPSLPQRSAADPPATSAPEDAATALILWPMKLRVWLSRCCLRAARCFSWLFSWFSTATSWCSTRSASFPSRLATRSDRRESRVSSSTWQ